MPFMFIKTNRTITAEQEMVLKSELGKAIALVPHKSEAVLMIEMQDKARLWLRGEQPPMAFVKISLFANVTHAGYPELTYAVTQILSQTLQIPPENLYVQFEDIRAWGVNGRYIE